MLYSHLDRPRLKTSCEISVVNELGLHARPAAEFVRLANSFISEISIVRNGRRYSAQSLIDVMRANLACGDIATLEAEGVDAERALLKLSALLKTFVD